MGKGFMSRVALFLLAGLLGGCAVEPFGAGTVRLVSPEGEIFVGRYMPVSAVGFPAGPPLVYGMGPGGAITHQQALLIGEHGEVITCRFDATTGATRPVCVRSGGQLVESTFASLE